MIKTQRDKTNELGCEISEDLSKSLESEVPIESKRRLWSDFSSEFSLRLSVYALLLALSKYCIYFVHSFNQ